MGGGRRQVQEARNQLVAARERLVELGGEVREQRLQNDVQAKRLERALKEWSSSDSERRRGECQMRVLEQARTVLHGDSVPKTARNQVIFIYFHSF